MIEKKIDEYLVQSVSKCLTKTQKPYLRLQLFDRAGKSWPAMFWEDMELTGGQVVKAMTEEGEYNGLPQLTISKMRVVDTPPDDFLPRTSCNINTLQSELSDFITGVKDHKLRVLLVSVYADERWLRQPAAKGMHHAYLGGLLEHVVNLCRLVDHICQLYKFLNKDLLITAAILHDIGKMDEIGSALGFEYTTDGELLGHITLGLLRVDKLMDELEFPEDLRRKVRHLILSHHGQLEWGSPKVPMMLEAVVFHRLDELDANIAIVQTAISKTAPGKPWSDAVKYKEHYYIGR